MDSTTPSKNPIEQKPPLSDSAIIRAIANNMLNFIKMRSSQLDDEMVVANVKKTFPLLKGPMAGIVSSIEISVMGSLELVLDEWH